MRLEVHVKCVLRRTFVDGSITTPPGRIYVTRTIL